MNQTDNIELLSNVINKISVSFWLEHVYQFLSEINKLLPNETDNGRASFSIIGGNLSIVIVDDNQNIHAWDIGEAVRKTSDDPIVMAEMISKEYLKKLELIKDE